MEVINNARGKHRGLLWAYGAVSILGSLLLFIPYLILTVMGVLFFSFFYLFGGMAVYLVTLIGISMYFRSKVNKSIQYAVDLQNVKYADRGLNFKLVGMYNSCLEIELGPIAV
jgi:hypothetical protein